MKKIFLLLLIPLGFGYSLNDVTKPYTFVARDTIKSAQLNANWDTLYGRINQINDSLDLRFARYSRIKDSTYDSLKAKFGRIDSIRTSTKIICDSMFTRKINFTNPDTAFFSCTLTGCAADVIGLAKYSKIGSIVTINWPTLLGTSNSTSATIKGLPSNIYSIDTINLIIVGADSSKTTPVGMEFTPNSGTVTLYTLRREYGTLFVNTGAKGISRTQTTYSIK
jgi:hypothetical protein